MIALLARVLADLRAERRLLAGVLGGTLLYALARIVPPLAARVLLDRTLAGHPAGLWGLTLSPTAAVIAVPGLLLVLAGVLAGIHYAIRVWSALLGQQLTGRLQVTLLAHLLRTPAPRLERRALGSQLIRFNSDMSAVKRFVSRSLPDLVRDMLAIAAIAGTLLLLHPPLGIVAIGVIGGYLVLAAVWWRHLSAAGHALRTARRRISGLAYDRLVVSLQVKLTGREWREARRLRGVQATVLARSHAVAAWAGRLSGAAELAVGVMVALTLGVGARDVLAGVMSRGEMVATYGLMLLLFGPLRALGRTFEALALGRVAFDRLYGILDAPVERDDPAASPLHVGAGAVAFLGVRVGGQIFPDLRVAPGVSILSAPPGSGLSVLGELLVGLRRADAGTVSIDDTDISGVRLRTLRRQVCFIPASAPLLKGSVRLNVLAGVDGGTDERALRALRAVGAAWAMPDILSAPVGTGGRRLSALQRWHVLCARAVAAGPAIVVLDGLPVTGPAVTPVLDGLLGAGVRSVLVLTEQPLPDVEGTHITAARVPEPAYA